MLSADEKIDLFRAFIKIHVEGMRHNDKTKFLEDVDSFVYSAKLKHSAIPVFADIRTQMMAQPILSSLESMVPPSREYSQIDKIEVSRKAELKLIEANQVIAENDRRIWFS